MDREATAIRLSAATNAGLGTLGTACGVWISSDAILLDGIFNWITFAMALVSLRVARLVARPPDESFPFGYAAFEPLLNTVKALTIVAVSVFAFVDAVQTILAGGRELAAGWALVYAGVAMTACFAMWLVQRRAAAAVESPLLEVDAKNWFVNGAISSAVGLAFALALVLEGAIVVPYIDSGLVVVLVVVTVPIPARMAWQGVSEMLGYAPPEEIRHDAHAAFEEAARDEGIEGFTLRMTRAGRTIFILAQAQVSGTRTAEELEGVRQRLIGRLKDVHPPLVMDVVFTPA